MNALVTSEWHDSQEGSCQFCSITDQYDSLDPKTMKYIGPERILHITFNDPYRPNQSIVTIRACFNHLIDVDNDWSRNVERER